METVHDHLCGEQSLSSSWMCSCLCLSSVLPWPGWVKEGYLAVRLVSFKVNQMNHWSTVVEISIFLKIHKKRNYFSSCSSE